MRLRLVFDRREVHPRDCECHRCLTGKPWQALFYRLESADPTDPAAPTPAELAYNVIYSLTPADAMLTAVQICERHGWLLVGVDYGPEGRVRP